MGRPYGVIVGFSGSDVRPRKSIRLQGYDYASAGAYFVTVCTDQRACILAQMDDDNTHLLDAGKVVENCWLEIPRHFKHASLDEFVIMPNHIHGIIVLDEPTVGETHGSSESMKTSK